MRFLAALSVVANHWLYQDIATGTITHLEPTPPSRFDAGRILQSSRRRSALGALMRQEPCDARQHSRHLQISERR
jgi:hypothetical protein